MTAEKEFEKLTKNIADSHDGVAGQMFGKRCIKVNGKAAIALFKENLVFKLKDKDHAKALTLKKSELWDPSEKGRAMKEWVQVDIAHKKLFAEFAAAAADYVS